jgi:hypothetical protein
LLNSGSQGGLAARVNHITNAGILGEIPVVESDSWNFPLNAPYNSYRRNTQGANSFCAPDLQIFDLDNDFNDCPNLDMSVWVANLGCLGVGAGVNVSFYEESAGYLGTVQTQNALAPGGAEQVKLTVPFAMFAAKIYAVVDDDGSMMGSLNECKEANNSTEHLLVCVQPG